MKRILLLMAFVLIVGLMCNGCCFLAGAGMGNAKEKRAQQEAEFHHKVGTFFERVSR